MDTWKGFRTEQFSFEDMQAILVFPDQANHTEKWLMKMEYWDAFQGLEYEMVRRGWHLAYLANHTRWCSEEDLERKKRFADFLIDTLGLEASFVPIGISCGGIFAVKFAAKYPNLVSALYLDAPVLNFLSCPADLGIGKSHEADGAMWGEFEAARKMTVSQLLGFRGHPLDDLPILARNRIPVVMVYGKEDLIVPYCENGMYLEKLYSELGIELLTIGKPGCAHHPHGLQDPKPIADFLSRIA